MSDSRPIAVSSELEEDEMTGDENMDGRAGLIITVDFGLDPTSDEGVLSSIPRPAWVRSEVRLPCGSERAPLALT